MGRLNVKVVPGSSRNQIVGWLGDALKIKVTAPPEKGQANEVVVELLASTLGISTDAIEIDLPPLNVATSRERISGGANQGRARDATRKEGHCGADHWEAPRG